MKIVVIGTGYVGLVSGACFAETGNTVTCVDTNEKKINALVRGQIPIYEPGLEELVERNVAQGRLSFTTELAEGLSGASACFIAVGTPPGEDGAADLQHVLAVARSIGRLIEHYIVVVNKSTVPVGTAEKVKATIKDELLKRGIDLDFDVASNPEFLKEGAAISDFMSPDRIVIGADSSRAKAVLSKVYDSFNRSSHRVLFMGMREAELTKYAANAMLATKISFINEVALLCEKLGVDVESVRQGIGSDRRIGYHFIYPGCGYGGSCFPKDVKALICTAKSVGFNPLVLSSVEQRNNLQKKWLIEKLIEKLGSDLTEKTVAVWGLSFKPGTDDVRESPSLGFVTDVISLGGRVKVFDPEASETFLDALSLVNIRSDAIWVANDPYAAVEFADALVLITEWKVFRTPDFSRVKHLMRGNILIDGRNQYDPAEVSEVGFEYSGVGRCVKGRAIQEGFDVS